MTTRIVDPAAQAFWQQFLRHRAVNKAFYARVPEDKLDYRMVETPNRRSDSPRESIMHQIYITKQYVAAATHGKLQFDITGHVPPSVQTSTKAQLVEALGQTERELAEVLSDASVLSKKVKVPWSTAPVPVITMLYGLTSHEILHEGWNLALMDHLDIERFPEFVLLWG